VDFVVAGMGIGALLVVVGFAVRDLGPLIVGTGAENRREQSEFATRRDQLIITIWFALSAAGGVILAATIVAIFLGVSDSVGTWIVTAAVLIGAAIAASLVLRFLRTEPGFQIAPPRRSSEPVAKSSAQPASRTPGDRPEPATVGTLDAEIGLEQHDESYDPTRLLPQEFGDHGNDSGSLDDLFVQPNAAPQSIELIPSEEPAAVTVVPDDTPAESPAAVEVDAVPEHSLAAESAPKAAGVPADAPIVGMAGFRSPLLADIVTEPTAEESSQFSSQLMADVAPDEGAGETFTSPVLADVTANADPAVSGDPASNAVPQESVDEVTKATPNQRPALEDASAERNREVG